MDVAFPTPRGLNRLAISRARTLPGIINKSFMRAHLAKLNSPCARQTARVKALSESCEPSSPLRVRGGLYAGRGRGALCERRRRENLVARRAARRRSEELNGVDILHEGQRPVDRVSARNRRAIAAKTGKRDMRPKWPVVVLAE